MRAAFAATARPPPRPNRRRLESIPDTRARVWNRPGQRERAAPRKLNDSPRKESTHDRFERAKEEREERKRRRSVASTS